MAEKNWLQISILVNGELAEAVSDVMGRFFDDGLVLEEQVEFDTHKQEAVPTGLVRVYGYLPVDTDLEEKRRKVEESIWYLGRIQPLPPLEFKQIANEDWMATWKKNYRPMPIGKKLVIIPSWLETLDEGRIPIRIDPGMAFGTGTHPTTQLCLELLEDYVSRDEAVIDVGCGSGILSIGAACLGAAPVLGVDIDPESVRASYENAAVNQVKQGVEFGLGSVTEVIAGKFGLTQAGLVLANILAPVIVDLLDAGLGELLIPGGIIIFSGILDHQVEMVAKAAQQHGLGKVELRHQGDWVAMVYRKEA